MEVDQAISLPNGPIRFSLLPDDCVMLAIGSFYQTKLSPIRYILTDWKQFRWEVFRMDVSDFGLKTQATT